MLRHDRFFQKMIRKLEADTSGIYDPTIRFASPPKEMTDMINCNKIKTILSGCRKVAPCNMKKMKRDEFEENFKLWFKPKPGNKKSAKSVIR